MNKVTVGFRWAGPDQPMVVTEFTHVTEVKRRASMGDRMVMLKHEDGGETILNMSDLAYYSVHPEAG